MAKIYAVRKGHKTGIFETWEECQEAIKGFSGAEFKSFGKPDDAYAYLNNVDVKTKNISSAVDDALSKQTVVAYVDGSFKDGINRYAFGCVIVTPNKEIIKESGCGDDPDAIAIHNIAGELLGTLFVCKWAITNGYKKIEIRHDYEGTAKWVTGEWRVKNIIVKKYTEQMEKNKLLLSISFTKVEAHTNEPLNDEADKLAKSALESGKKTRVQKGESWFTADGITIEELETILSMITEEIANIKITKNDIAYGKRFDLTLQPKEKITIQYFTDNRRVSIQGKPLKLFSVIVTYITELIDVEKIPEIFNSYFKLEIDKENVKTEFKSYLPHAAGKLPVKIDRVLHQAVYNLNVFGDMFDATFLVEPVLRALEGHLKFTLKTNGIDLKEAPEDKQDKFHMFDKVGVKYQLKSDFGVGLDSGVRIYLGKCYTHFNNKRHTLSHWDDPTVETDTTSLINNPNDAHVLIKDTLLLIDEYYELIQ